MDLLFLPSLCCGYRTAMASCASTLRPNAKVYERVYAETPRPHFAVAHRGPYAINGSARPPKPDANATKPVRIKNALIILGWTAVAGTMGTLIGTTAGGLFGLVVGAAYGAFHGMLGEAFVWMAWWAFAGALAGAITGTTGRLFEGTPLPEKSDGENPPCRNTFGG